MQVQTFECEETATEAVEFTEEARAIIEKLDLKGQREFTLSKEDDGGTVRCPYRKMTAEEDFVYRVICPSITPIERYAESTIPIRVLQVAAHASQFFTRLDVWHATSVSVKDPVLVGVKKNTERSWQEDKFILARWADALDEWPAIVKTALRLFTDKTRDYLSSQIAEAESFRGMLSSDIALTGAMQLHAKIGNPL